MTRSRNRRRTRVHNHSTRKVGGSPHTRSRSSISSLPSHRSFRFDGSPLRVQSQVSRRPRFITAKPTISRPSWRGHVSLRPSILFARPGPAFVDPDKQKPSSLRPDDVCSSRREKREMIFATKSQGAGNSRPKWTALSRRKCKK